MLKVKGLDWLLKPSVKEAIVKKKTVLSNGPVTFDFESLPGAVFQNLFQIKAMILYQAFVKFLFSYV